MLNIRAPQIVGGPPDATHYSQAGNATAGRGGGGGGELITRKI